MGKTETKKKSPEPPFGRGKYLKKVVGFLSKTKKKFWTFKDWKIYIDLDTSRIIEEEVPLDFVLEYVKYSPSKIKTFDFLKKALSKNGLALQFCSDLRKSNMYLVLIAVRQNGFALQFANYQLKDSINIVKPAVEQNALALQFASNILKNYKEVVLTAVEQNGLALQFASDRLKKNKEVVLTAIRNNPDSYKYVSYILKNDREILEILGYNPQLIGLTNTINNINNIKKKKESTRKRCLSNMFRRI